MITLKLLLWLIPIIAFVALDYYEIVKKKSRPIYLLENIVKGGLFIAYASLIWHTLNDWRTVAIAIYCLFSWWILFDLLLNAARHKDPFYIGEGSGWIDRFAYINSTTFVIYWIAKGLAVYLCIESIRYIYNH